MATIMCRLFPVEEKSQNKVKKGVLGAGVISVLEIFPVSGKPYRLVVSRQQLEKFSFGDRIKSVSGKTFIMIKPGTNAGAFFLSPEYVQNKDPKYRTELEINDETTRPIMRGKIEVSNDIGTILRATSSTTR